MLERTLTCLEPGRRLLLRSRKPCLHIRCALHSSVLPRHASHPPVASPSVQTTSVNATTEPNRPHHGLVLDFLYPEQTLALIKHLSHNRLLPYTDRVRCYSTVPPQVLHEDPSLDAYVLEQIKKEVASLVRASDAIVELKKILLKSEPGKQELAWQLYTIVGKDRLVEQSELMCHLLEYLVQDGTPAVPSRVVQVYTDLNPVARRPSSYRAAIIGYATAGLIAPAINLLEEIDPAQGFDILHCGISAIFRRTVSDEQWDLTFRVWRDFLGKYPTHRGLHLNVAIRYGDILPEIWRDVLQLPQLLEHFQSFLRHVREFKNEIDPVLTEHEFTNHRELACFVMTFIPHVMQRVLNAKSPDEDFIYRWFAQTFDDLNSLGLPTSACYEYAIKTMLKIPRYQAYTNKRKLWLKLYFDYRQRYLDDEARPGEKRPSEILIRQLVYQYTERGGTQRAEEFVQDLRLFYPSRPLRPGLLRRLISHYSIAGNADKVQEYIDVLGSTYPGEMSLEILTSLIHAYARRADVEGAINQFKRIHEEFKMTPDLACWNVLILAYVRADDLDGALECFNNCVEFGFAPDILTFGPLLEFCAWRGDIEAFEALFSKARQMGVQVDRDVRARSAYVLASLNAGDPEGAEAIALGMLKSWRSGTLYGHPLTHTWNLLIQEYALNRDLASSRQYYKQMVENNIPVDSWTFGSLMRALVEVKQTNAAYRLLRYAMPEHNVQVHALHYAIVMTGFLRENQLDLAMHAYERMKSLKVTETESSRQASLQVLGQADLMRLKKRRLKNNNLRLLRVQEAIEEVFLSSTCQDIAHDQPRHERFVDTHAHGAVPQIYYGLVISLYSARSAYKICQKLFKKAEAFTPYTQDNIHTLPLTLTTAMMESHYKAGNHPQVAKCWELVHTSATKLTKTFSQIIHQPEPVTASNSLLDPSIQQRFAESRIASNRRHILNKPSRIYVRSLLAQPDPSALDQVQSTIHSLLVNGFVIDNFIWNEYIQQLALQNRIVEAFTLCEEYLMPRFPGWRRLSPNSRRRDRKGYQLMELRHYEITKSSVIPRYKTMLVLAKAFAMVRQDERSGIRYDHEAQAWMTEILEQKAPDTVRAIETMPRTNDRLQERAFPTVG